MFEFYNADVTGRKNNIRYPNKIEVTDEASLKKAVSRDYVCAKYLDCCRSNKNFVSSNCLAFDVDNDESDDASDWMTPEKITRVFQNITLAFHFSRHHMLDKHYVDEATAAVTKTVTARPRFHVFFEIDPVSDYAEYKKLKEKVVSLFPYFDKGAMDSARFFYGTENPAVEYHQGTMTLNEFLFPADFDKELSKIKVGSRNNTLSHFAGKVLKRFGDTDEAYQMFLDLNNNCESPLDDAELASIWNSALRFFKDTVLKNTNYIPAAEYNAVKDEKTSNGSWDEPIPLCEGELAVFPIDALPAVLKNYALSVSRSTQTPVDMAAVAALTTASACMRNLYKVEGKSDWKEPTNIYAVIVAESSERKSAVTSLITKPVDSFVREYNENHKLDIEMSKVMKQQLENKKNALISKSKKNGGEVEAAVDFDETLKDVVKRIADFKEVNPLKVYLDDTTPEKLTESLSDNGGTLAIISSEGGIFDVLSGTYANKVNIDVFLKAYSGENIAVERIMRRSVSVNEACLTILLSVQPVVISEFMSNKKFRHRGLTARFLYTIPKSLIGSRTLESDPLDEKSYQAYKGLIYNLLSEKREGEARLITLSPNAKKILNGYYDWVEKRLTGESSVYSDWLGKLVGNTLRIAGILARCSTLKKDVGDAVFETDQPVIIDEKIMEDAISLGKYFLVHAVKAYGDMGVDTNLKVMLSILEKLREKKMSTITRRGIMRCCSGIGSSKDAQAILDTLEDYGYVRLSALDASDKLRNGRPKNAVYTVNPLLIRS